MKKIVLSSTFLFITAFAFGQSITLKPDDSDSELIIKKYSDTPEFIGMRASGSPSSPAATSNAVNLALFGGAGYNGTTFTGIRSSIQFRTTQSWTSTANGNQIIFSNTPNNSTTLTDRMVINHDGNVGIGNASPSAKLHINHLASGSSPTLHLQSTGSASSFIRATSTAVGSEWDNHFINSATASGNFVYWTNSVSGSTPLILTGQGDAIIERNTSIGGFTKLGGASAPSVKMKRLSGTFNSASNTLGTATNIPHGVADPTKIISISVLGQYVGSGGYVSNSFLTTAGYQFDYQVDGVNIIVTPKMGNSLSLVSQNIKIVITYEE